jgi:hypothetical protein
MRGYLSKYWKLAISANRFLEEDNDKGEVWVRKTILQLWEFAREMWEHRNEVLHNTELSSPQEKCEMQISMMLSRNYTRRRIPTQPKIVGTLRSFLWFSTYESHYDRDVDGSRMQEYWQTSRSTVL